MLTTGSHSVFFFGIVLGGPVLVLSFLIHKIPRNDHARDEAAARMGML